MRHIQLVISSDFPGHRVPLHLCCKQNYPCMIYVSDLPINCSVFLLNISGIHTLILIIIHSWPFLYIYLVHVIGLCVMEIISVGVLDLGVYGLRSCTHVPMWYTKSSSYFNVMLFSSASRKAAELF